MLDNNSFLRYSRQLLLDEIGLNGQTLLSCSTVLVVGLGGLGSPAVLYLAAAGIGKLIIADNDKLNITNLQRQILYNTNEIGKLKVNLAQKKLVNLNPDGCYISLKDKINNSYLDKYVKDVNLVLDCSDNMITRYNINSACVRHNKPLISASATGFDGQIIRILPPWENGCYSCLFPDLNKKTIDDKNCSSFGILGPVVGLMGTLQALEAIKFLCNITTPMSSNQGTLWLFNGKYLTWKNLQLSKNPLCPVCA
ncbi:molybdopterin-synthase adenylyltransferase MoeB (plasmid) [Candidatus Pantoea edessiphila]|uniref:Molybdopterin-synthase adenylyltransferase MoeB n=1 Tax=Candidatus Pantoea edessiphila TaxID=2044610 RepID=A0A2P5SX88_9GAMM|nr:HesA/MoeB/ThiF family protein [Candidatus Pantoea edessiphila]MBK4775898.1 HesA/MoeB/ThiF family protein [Pantoea sp. Edef]PPI86949.1 molybdopterin-synthase adenylyltransferase MoeB [Candidatus Pantoea edessiphila]